MIVFVTGGSGFVGEHLIRRLAEDGHQVRALARSASAAAAVQAAGAEAVDGDLTNVAAMSGGMQGAGAVVHSAAMLTTGPREEKQMYEVNVVGTRNVIQATQQAGVPRLVHVSTEQAIFGDKPLINADETWPYPEHPRGPYAATKGEAERLVLAAAGDTLRTVAVRPRFVWGPGDKTVLPAIIDRVRSGTFRWVGGGNYLTSTCHVLNVVDGIIAAIDRGENGQAYFLTDGAPVVFRTFISELLATQGVTPPTASIPRPVATAAAVLVESLWLLMRRPGPPPLDRATLAVIGAECTVNDSRARERMGFVPQISVEVGLAGLVSASP